MLLFLQQCSNIRKNQGKVKNIKDIELKSRRFQNTLQMGGMDNICVMEDGEKASQD